MERKHVYSTKYEPIDEDRRTYNSHFLLEKGYERHFLTMQRLTHVVFSQRNDLDKKI
jgi:hypothetical protein